MAIHEVVSEFTETPKPRGKLRKLARARPLPEPVHSDPRSELRRLVKQHANWNKTIVSLDHMRSDRTNRETGETIPCLLPTDTRADLERAEERLRENDDRLVREMARALKQLPIWKTWLRGVAGIAEKTGAILVGETDISLATKPSSLKMFFGTCPDVATGRLVRRTAGQKNRYHSGIRTALYTAFESMPKNGAKATSDAPHGQTNKYLDVWHNALFGSLHDPRFNGKTWHHQKPDGTQQSIPGGHLYLRKRAMWKAVEVFVEDLYVVWRALDGLPVWPDYYDVRRGHMHGGTPIGWTGPRAVSLEEALELVGNCGWRPLSVPRTWKTKGDTSDLNGVAHVVR